MWPGQQAGGEQHPQQQNPYQQPVPPGQQPGPYAQPGPAGPQPGPYAQPGPPGPYAQPQQPYQSGQWGPPEQPGPSVPPEQPGHLPPPGTGGKEPVSTQAVVGMIAAFAVLASAVVVGVIVWHNRGDGGATPAASGSPSASASAGPSASAPGGNASVDPENPRGSAVQPVVEGWKAVANNKRHNAFDVPAGWEVKSAGLTTGFESDDGEILVAMTGVATYKDNWCGSASRAMAGTKGAVGARNTKEAAGDTAESWVLAAYDQKQKGALKKAAVEPFTNGHGVSGHIARASVTGVPKAKDEDGCLNTDGKAVAVSFKDKEGAMASFVLISDTGVPEEIPDSVINQITGSLRLL
ncbi:hypothetical protein AB0M28_11095 [Streptomyces sp. NPDC051940]|uniref:hypothetical protein n=1 Tax=Streptomyces sp. NPDC051940 TaxID=3155675 RepID=UPI00343873B1